MCLECWSKKETKMKIEGTWDDYQKNKMNSIGVHM